MAQPSFYALRQPVFRAYFFGAATAMMADSIEHVISYWIMFQKFQSPALAGFAVISHWVPFILFSLWSGALADRYDPRRIIQAGMLVFMAVSIAWGVLFMTDALEMWHAGVLLTLHGLAGVLWGPASQLFIHDIVEEAQLHSAIRLTATARWLGLLMGLVGSRFGIVGVLLLLLAYCAVSQIGGLGGGGEGGQAAASKLDPNVRSFLVRALGSTEETWGGIFQQAGGSYRPTNMVAYSGGTQTACGLGQAAMGPFYCPTDQTIYIDPAFFNELSQRFGAPAAGAEPT